MSNVTDLVRQAEQRAKSLGLTITSLCAAAKVHPSNWRRWRDGDTGPTMKNWAEVERVLQEATAAQETAGKAA